MSFHGDWLAAAFLVATTGHAQVNAAGIPADEGTVRSIEQVMKLDQEPVQRQFELAPKPLEQKELEQKELERKKAAEKELVEDRKVLHRGTALTVAGGVSLGAYQAGFLYYYTRFLQEYARHYESARLKNGYDLPALAPLKVVTGASAGSVNALLAAMTSCSNPLDDPKDSPFWQVWMGVGVAELRAEPGGKGSVFSETGRDAMAKSLQTMWRNPRRWSSHPCAVRVGISATRLTARTLQVGPLMSNNRLTEKFIFQIAKSDGEGPPRLEHVRLKDTVDPRFYPRLGWAELPQIDDVTDLLLASSAFPLAFHARPLNYGLFEGIGIPLSRQSGLFIDGGVLDNQPVKLAQSLVTWSARDSSPPLLIERKAPESPPEFVYVDTSAVAYAGSADLQASILDISPVMQYGRFLTDYLSAAGQSEFLDAAEDTQFAGRLTVPQRTLPVAGEHLMHFAAFAEQVFRRNDFYVGMVDASLFLARHSRQYQMLARSVSPDAAAGVTDPLPIFSDEYACYRSRMVTGRDRPCEHVDERLLQVLRACLAVRTRILVGERRADLSDVFFDELEKGGFTYDDLAKGRRLSARQVRSELRDVLEVGVVALARSDGLVNRYMIESVGRELGNAALLHRGPDRFWALGSSNRRGIDITWSPVLIGDRWRPSIALQIFNIDVQSIQYAPGTQAALPPTRAGQRSIDNSPGFGVTLGLHPRFTYSVPLGTVIQLEFGAGYTGAIRLTSDWTNSFVSLRHGPVASVTLLGFERLYVDLSAVRYLDGLSVVADAYQRPDIIPVVGRRSFDLLLGVGWRFY